MPQYRGTDDDIYRRELSRRLLLLMDVVEANSGKAPTYREIAAELEEQGLHLSRGRWAYMLAGNGLVVRDEPLLTGLAKFFGVPADYLTDPGEGPMPERVTAQLELVLELRKKQIIRFAARRLDYGATVKDIRDLTAALEEMELPD